MFANHQKLHWQITSTLVILWSLPPQLLAQADTENTYQSKIAPFLQKHCISCHGNQKQESDLRFDQKIPLRFDESQAKGWWSEIVNVLNSHEMPPESEVQPDPKQVAEIVDWIVEQLSNAERNRKDSSITLRRLNRTEYKNTLRDLLLVDVDISQFPIDPPADGFDNNGKALTVSPMLLELYIDTASRILQESIVTGAQPDSISWRFEPESGNDDSNRVRYGPNNAIVNGGNNPVERGMKVLHHASWDKNLNARDFVLPSAGYYLLRVRAGSKIPDRKEVVASAERILADRRDKQIAENPKGEKWHREQYEADFKHFESDRIYDYGPPRLKIIRDLGGQPTTVAEFDVDASKDAPKVYEFQVKFTTERAGVTVEYAYDLPPVLENFWFQGHDAFARPTAYVDWFEIEGPIYDHWPPSSHIKILGATPLPEGLSSQIEEKRVREILLGLMRRAYRRPLRKGELDEKWKLYEATRKNSESIQEAIKTPLIAILCSPHFLFLEEPLSEKGEGARKLSDHEFAARLSYFLWSSMPDDELMKLATNGRLRDKNTLRAQVDRMLKDSKSSALITNFTGQWLGLRDVGSNPPAKDLYPEYDRHLETSMVRESEAFFEEILRSKSSVLNFIRSDFVVINERLARYYGIDNVRGDQFRKVTIDGKVPRGGVVTQASIHTITSNGTRTSPVKRGTWILKNILGTDPGLPVANAGDIAPKVPGIDKATVRKRLEIHRTLPQCARCHNKIDPLGFALENYNAAGKWRDQEGFGYKGRIDRDDPKIDASSKLPDGTSVDGVRSLQDALLKNESLFLKCLSSKMATYALGRELGVADQKWIGESVGYVQANDYQLQALINFIVESEAFGMK